MSDNPLEEKVSRAIDSYLSRTGRMTTHTSADWLIEDMKAEGLIIIDLENLDLTEEQRKLVVKFAQWFSKEPPAVQEPKKEKPPFKRCDSSVVHGEHIWSRPTGIKWVCDGRTRAADLVAGLDVDGVRLDISDEEHAARSARVKKLLRGEES